MNITDLLDNFKISYREVGQHHHTREGWIQINCPFCGSDNYHLGISVTAHFASCWRCGGHSLWNVLLANGVPPRKIKQALGELDSVRFTKQTQGQGVLKEPSRRGPLEKAHRQYLRERDFNVPEIEKLWQLEGIGLHAQLSWRIYIPIHTKGERTSWTTRAIGSKVTQRYISAAANEESVPHKQSVYGLDFCRGSVVIVEGPTDAWAIGPGAGALFGTAFTPAQVLLLANVPRRFICFDSSIEAQKRAKDLGGQLACFPGTTENWVISAKDPGSASKKEISSIRRAAGLD